MKLYATVTSERATKAQGGNKEVRVLLNVGSRDDTREIAQLILNAEADQYSLYLLDSEGLSEQVLIKTGSLHTSVIQLAEEIKGNK